MEAYKRAIVQVMLRWNKKTSICKTLHFIKVKLSIYMFPYNALKYSVALSS